jgi:hypothetical protein
MANLVLGSAVSMSKVTPPVAGVQYNVHADLGADGIDGIKTGWEPQGGRCFVFSATTVVDGSSVSVVGACLTIRGKCRFRTRSPKAKGAVGATEKGLTTLRLPLGHGSRHVASAVQPSGRGRDELTNLACHLAGCDLAPNAASYSVPERWSASWP